MCRKWLYWRKRLVHAILHYSDITSIVVGMLPYNFYHQTTKTNITNITTSITRSTTCRSIRSREHSAQKAITLLHIMAVLAIMFGGIALFMHSSFVVVEYYDEKPVSDFLNEVHSAFSLFAVIVILMRNWLHATPYMRLLREMQQLRCTFHTTAAGAPNQTAAHRHACAELEHCAAFDWYVIAGALIRLVQNVSMVHALITLVPNFRAMHVLLVLLVLLLSNITYCMQYQFNYGVLHIYRYTWTLNERLLCLVAHSTQPGAAASAVLDIVGVSLRLQRWSEQLMRHYDWQLLMIICLYVNSNALNMYNFCVVWSGKIHTLTFDAVFSFMQIVIVNVMDFWYMIDVCELTLSETRRTNRVLRGLLERQRYVRRRGELQRHVELLSLVRCCRPMRFSLNGMFVLDHGKGYKLFIITLTYFIVLVQYDFLNM